MNLRDVTRSEAKAAGIKDAVRAANLLAQGRTLEDVSKETGIDIETLKELSPIVVH